MKKFFVVILALLLISGLFACNQAPAEHAEVPQTPAEQKTETPDPAPATEPEPIPETKTVFERFEDALTAKGLSFEKSIMAAQLVGAEAGAKYKIGSGTVELYSFDRTSEAYKAAESKQAVTLDGFGDFPAKVVGGYAMLVDGLDADTYNDVFVVVIE